MFGWKWSTFFVLFFIAYFSTFLIYLAESKGIKQNTTKKKYDAFGLFCYISVFVILVIFAITRNVEMYPFGSIDMRYYIYQFQNVQLQKIDWNLILRLKQDEPLYYILIKSINYFTSSYRIYWLVVYSIVSYGLLKGLSSFIDNNIKYSLLPIYFTIYFYGLSAIQTALSISFALIALTYLKKDKIFKSLIFLFLSSMFHYVSLVLLPLVLWVKFLPLITKYSRRKIVTIMSLAFAVLFLFSTLVKNILMDTKYHTYLDESLTIKGQLIVIILSVLTLFFYKSMVNKFNDNSMYINIVLYNFLSIPYVIDFGVYRLNLYFQLFRIIVWSLLFELVTTKFFKTNDKLTSFILNLIVIIVGFILFSKLIFDMHNIGIMPYFNEDI